MPEAIARNFTGIRSYTFVLIEGASQRYSKGRCKKK